MGKKTQISSNSGSFNHTKQHSAFMQKQRNSQVGKNNATPTQLINTPNSTLSNGVNTHTTTLKMGRALHPRSSLIMELDDNRQHSQSPSGGNIRAPLSNKHSMH
jgi:hypothetical protein